MIFLSAMDKISIIVAGGRDFNDYEYLKKTLSSIINSAINNEFEIVSGTARGADRLGERFAVEYNLPIKKFPADWDKYGKSAGYKRNYEMAKYAKACVIFWDGISRGTGHMIDLAQASELALLVKKY